MFKYSLVIPHYNEAQRLELLLESIPSRDDIQVIVVDDCSTDQEKFSELKRLFHEVVFLSTNKNSGAGAARNIGLLHIKGHYTLFADADDRFHPDAFYHFDEAVKRNADIYYFRADAKVEKTGERSVRADSLNKLVDEYLISPNAENEFKLRLKHCVPWAKVYKSSFIKRTKIKFEEIPVSNDVYFNVINGALADKVFVSKNIVYICYRLSDSLTSTTTADRLICRLKASAHVADKLESLGISHGRSASGFIVQSLSFGPIVFFQALAIAMSSNLHLNLSRVVNLKRWLSFYRRKKEQDNEKSRE